MVDREKSKQSCSSGYLSRRLKEEDRISQLPDPLICHILSHLPTKDSVKTSVLSTRWRTLWLWLPILELDSTKLPDLSAFMSLGDRFFDSNRVSYIRKLKLTITHTSFVDGVDDNGSVFTSWIDAAVKRKVQRLHVHFPCLDVMMPLSLSTCETLVSLKLHMVALPYTESVSLPCLKTMRLTSVWFPDEATFERLVSSCLVLEELEIEGEISSKMDVFRVFSKSLKKLTTRTYSAVKRKVKIPFFDNKALIEGYSKTVVGRCLNPRAQDMKSLLVMFPRFWNLEGKVVGADLGMGKFQFDFDDEVDIDGVMKLVPFHFDQWMVSMVRWSPTVDPLYPSALTFWVRVMGVPVQFWAVPTFTSIGEALGTVVEVDLDGGRVQVMVNGLKPLCFETEVEFFTGEETTVSLRYERLYGVCSKCSSLCHDDKHCPPLEEPTLPPMVLPRDDADRRLQSYKGAVKADRQPGTSHDSHNGGSRRGPRGPLGREGSQLDGKRPFEGKFGRGPKPRSDTVAGEPLAKQRCFKSYVQYNEYRHSRASAKASGSQMDNRTVSDGSVAQIEEGEVKTVPVARRALFQEGEDGGAVGLVASQPSTGPAAEGTLSSVEAPLLGILPEEPVDLLGKKEVDTAAIALVADKDVDEDAGGDSLSPAIEGLVLGGTAVTVSAHDPPVPVGPAVVVPAISAGVSEEFSVDGNGLADPMKVDVLIECCSDEEVSMEEVGGDPEESPLKPDDAQEDIEVTGMDAAQQDSNIVASSSSVVEKLCKGKGLLGSKKLNVYVRTPRKRPVPKVSTAFGQSLPPKPQEMDKGANGGPKPPLPRVAK
ncbi:PREDICTED: uncharacterized protein LOC104773458 [Camelina sativa]|uniref:Uncharacterized protein LOC104773458 n=1 Tax=Camelina sativa TaxID=90675 RepID=A0ABM0Y6N2_CAMSA|nr:PREDICTED: uncharacterized protein LOC104773458 [Camelina sativa]